MRLLLIEDRGRIASLTVAGLGPFGYQCDIAACLASADDMLEVVDYDAIVLDLGLPDGDGCVWLTQHRSSGLGNPVLILSARASLEDRIRGLDGGADDYLVKPFVVEELAARLRAILRRPGGRTETLLTVGDIQLDPNTMEARCKGQLIGLSPREGALLELFMRRAGTVVTRCQIESTLYAYEQDVTANAIEAMVSRLRKKLHAAGDVLITLRGIGYLLVDVRH